MDWSTNPIKLRRAIDSLPKDATEQEIKAVYLKLGGSIASGYVEPVAEVVAVLKKATVKEKVAKAIKKVTKKK